MRIGVLGSGIVGRTLGAGLAARGHDVQMGSRSPERDEVRTWVEANGSRASAASPVEAAKFGEVIILATPWDGTENALHLAGAENLAGKVVLDVTNPLAYHENAPPTLTIGHTDSGGEQVQRWLADARVVKVFNTVGNRLMVDPDLPCGPPDMFICGNDAAAKETVASICAELGWPVIDIGGIEGARLLEPLCLLWVVHGLRTNSWDHAFRLLGK